MNVYNRIKEIREAKSISQIQMATDLNVSRQTMNAIEKTKYNPSLELSLKIAKYFQMSVEEIFELEDEK
ncbi:putative transcriptional regulator [Enterococcus sp. PF1-24]|uniref:helix-turn-helix transcriptional regulator n=1 Tax=unclassified Enterococcus TaxID=2608891 RepID=UPI002477144A|nr:MULTISPECIES: helix-turn-helix transcriptional regulator [unclassified Enterococcus]MDH6364410.1 putative transcriptional regulator [Enterococcus sp. PFB1-1]MDH6401567.1 putative transcriptional regulator [Enterococcus sp. PF1-24]